jgi:hypothetical protein
MMLLRARGFPENIDGQTLPRFVEWSVMCPAGRSGSAFGQHQTPSEQVLETSNRERGYDATTVDDICAAAEISRSTFFRYFPTKKDALGTAGSCMSPCGRG